jgi:hypothetical protein
MQLDIYSEVTRTAAIALVSGRTTVSASSAIDLKGYEGIGELELIAELASAGTNPTLAVKVQECDTSGGTYADVDPALAFATVTGAANGGVQALKMNFSALKRFIKVVPTLGGTSTPTFTFGVTLRGRKKVFGTPTAQSL